MKNRKTTADAVDILHKRYVKGDAGRKLELEVERVNAYVARLIHDQRKEAGLSQEELAELVGTTQSVISRLEDADYEGHSLTMLNRIAGALSQKLTVVMTAEDPKDETLRYAFQLVVQNLRRERGLTLEQVAEKTGIDRKELSAMERIIGYRPSPLSLHRLSRFYQISERRLAALAGAIEPSEEVRECASRFAAQSDSFAKLTREEKKILDRFVNFLKTET
jgi:transcriptional regulator with XRE-family HTH domain